MPKKAIEQSHRGKFAKRLRKIREARGWSQNNLAAKARMTQAMLSYLEAGKKEPGWDTVQALADAFGVSTDEFREKGK